MKKKRKYVWIAIAVVLCLLLAKVIFFLFDKPKIEIDYIAKINALSRPLNYDPNKDGFKDLEKASELYVKPSADIVWELWPHEMNDTSILLLKKWITSNSEAIDTFKKASESDYIWIELRSGSHGGDSIAKKWPENDSDVRRCLFWRAKLNASEGNFNKSLEDILTLWRYENILANPNYPLGWQINRLSGRQNILDDTIAILDLYRPAVSDLEIWQRKWNKQFDSDSYEHSFEAERLDCYSRIQHTFVHKKNGSGRIYWKYVMGHLHLCGCEESDSLFDVLLVPTVGPTASGVCFQVDSMITRYNKIIRQYPWDVRYPEQQYVQFQETYNKKHIFEQFIPSMLRHFTIFYHRVKMKQDALITILAILRFNSQHGRYPSDLIELVQKGFLGDLPRDPFSRGPLMYNPFHDDFELYSVGPDFADDGGKIFQHNSIAGAPIGDEVFWAPLRKGRKNLKFINRKALDDFR